jgi:hypothetical protein
MEDLLDAPAGLRPFLNPHFALLPGIAAAKGRGESRSGLSYPPGSFRGPVASD